jgi:hypothetical protein
VDMTPPRAVSHFLISCAYEGPLGKEGREGAWNRNEDLVWGKRGRGRTLTRDGAYFLFRVGYAAGSRRGIDAQPLTESARGRKKSLPMLNPMLDDIDLPRMR